MKALASVLVALSVLAAASLPLLAADDEYDFPGNIFDKMERQLP